MTLPAELYTAAQIRAIEAAAIVAGNTAFDLMHCAGEVAFHSIGQRWPASRALLVLAGKGNNGGDGFVVAALARAQGLRVTVLQCGDPATQGPALQARELAVARAVEMQQFSPEAFQEALARDPSLLVVDALLGTGSRGSPRDDIAQAIALINRSGLPVLALDIPSGLCADTGFATDLVVHASVTASFVGLKQGLFTGRGPACCGEILFHDLGTSSIARTGPASRRITMQSVAGLFPARPADAHKGDHGRVVIVGGELGYGGAVIMAAEAAARCGAGTVAALTRSAHIGAMLARRPEIMVHGVDEAAELSDALLLSASVIVAGPGLGRTAWSRRLFQQVLRAGLSRPLVIDADGLNLLAESRGSIKPRENWILTPHPGEAARLLGCDTAAVQSDRFAAVRALQQRWGGACLLKGAGSLLCYNVNGQQQVDICTEGNPGMATGGMGDVLSGMIAAFSAQGLSLSDSLRAGTCVHGECADQAALRRGQRGLLATDLFQELGPLINPQSIRNGSYA